MESCELDVTILSVSKFREFRGNALLAGFRPNFAVACILDGSARPYQPEGSELTFTIRNVVVFAVDSLIKIFIDDEILGNTYRLRIESMVKDGMKRYFLTRT
jgi:hypothetical protein